MEQAQRYLAMLIESLQLLAADYDTQIQSLPNFVHIPDELALIYDECVLLLDQIAGSGLVTIDQVHALRAIDTMLEVMNGQAHANFWTLAALKDDPHWAHIQSAAQVMLRTFGVAPRMPDTSWIHFIPGGRTEPKDNG